MFAGLLNWIGSLSAKAGTKACLAWFVDEHKMPKSLLPKPSKIAKRGLYEMMWGAKPRDYGKRLKKGKI